METRKIFRIDFKDPNLGKKYYIPQEEIRGKFYWILDSVRTIKAILSEKIKLLRAVDGQQFLLHSISHDAEQLDPLDQVARTYAQADELLFHDETKLGFGAKVTKSGKHKTNPESTKYQPGHQYKTYIVRKYDATVKDAEIEFASKATVEPDLDLALLEALSEIPTSMFSGCGDNLAHSNKRRSLTVAGQ